MYGLCAVAPCVRGAQPAHTVEDVFSRVEGHSFHPLNEAREFTHDRNLKKAGIADLNNRDWNIRLLAVYDLVRLGLEDPSSVFSGLDHANEQVRYLSAMTLGILKVGAAAARLERLAEEDPYAIVRSQAVIALGQMESTASLSALRALREADESRDVRHQCELAIDQIEKRMGTTAKNLAAFRDLDASKFNRVEVGRQAPDFELEDTEGDMWRLSDFRGNHSVLLIWVFADWCPVCHGEFRELMEMQPAFARAGVEVVTLECHDRYRGRVMVGKELDPDYWFSKESFQETYTKKIWWPHLLDRAGAVGAMYGVDPLAFAVHAEYINRPSTVIIDPQGVVRFAYYGTYWGDRPSVRETLDMIETERFEFEHPKRLLMPAGE